MKFKTEKEIAELRRQGKHDEADLEEARVRQALGFRLPELEKKRVIRQFMKDLHGV